MSGVLYVLFCVAMFLLGWKAGAIWGYFRAMWDGELERREMIEALRYGLKALEKVDAPIFSQRFAIGRIAQAIHNATGEPVVAANTFNGSRP